MGVVGLWIAWRRSGLARTLLVNGTVSIIVSSAALEVSLTTGYEKTMPLASKTHECWASLSLRTSLWPSWIKSIRSVTSQTQFSSLRAQNR